MPKGPKGQKRPVDAVSNAVLVMQIATGQTEDLNGKNPAAVALGHMGGTARAKNLNKKQRSAIAKKAAEARWK